MDRDFLIEAARRLAGMGGVINFHYYHTGGSSAMLTEEAFRDAFAGMEAIVRVGERYDIHSVEDGGVEFVMLVNPSGEERRERVEPNAKDG